MHLTVAPALWLIVVIVGLPQLSETIYTPSLPDIAHALRVSDSLVEYTLTIYLLGFAIGTLFWGKLSDHIGRKPCLLAGLGIYVLGSLGCYLSGSIELLLISRFVQALGGSTGSVLGQAIARDAFYGLQLSKVYATVGSALAFSPAIGPVMGGVIDQVFGWPSIFLMLMVVGLSVMVICAVKLPETHFPSRASRASITETALRLLKDKRVLAFGAIVAGANGIMFSYYAEGPFYLIELLGLSPSLYGISFVTIALSGGVGAWLSRRMHENKPSIAILGRGLQFIGLGSAIFTLGTLAFHISGVAKGFSIALCLGSMMIITMGIGMALPTTLSMALRDHRHAIGTASSLFGFFYYALISLVTLGMGTLHNGTLIPMPIYFLSLASLMWIVFSRALLQINSRRR